MFDYIDTLGGLALGYGLRLFREFKRAKAPLPEAPAQKCGTVTYFYSDETSKTFHNCEGFTDFSITFGKSQAPPGATLVKRQGGVHR